VQHKLQARRQSARRSVNVIPLGPGSSRLKYHLRLCLTPEGHVSETRALFKVIERGRIDEVMFFVPHAEERSPGLGTDAENERLAEILAPVFRRLRRLGVAPSINLWWAVSFSEFPGLRRNLRDRFAFHWAVGADGRESDSAACPTCPAWRAQIERMCATYARLKPERVWIDDDVRMTLRADLHSPCFCERCLAEMVRRTGRAWDRRDLLAAIMADPPNPVRDQWLDYQRALELDVVAGMARAVHAESPATRVSLMVSPPPHHAAEGRRWDELIAALGEPRGTVRPWIGPYVESTAPGVAAGLANARLTQAVVPVGTALAPEIENYPHTRFSKSAALVRAHMEVAPLFGMHDITFSIFRFGGRLDLELAREDAWSSRLAAAKPRLEALAALEIAPTQFRGVALYWHEQSARFARGAGEGAKPILLFRQRPWDVALALLGFATQFQGEGAVTAFAGEEIDGLADEALAAVFRGGVLLDARAAETMLRRGAGDLCGVKARLPDCAASHETIEDAAFGGIKEDIINCRWSSPACQFEWMEGTRVISRLRGYDRSERGHGVVLFENRLGGRVVVAPWDSQAPATASLGVAFPSLESPSFLSWPRQAQLAATLEWAGRGPLPLRVMNAPNAYPVLVEQPGRTIVGVVNLSPDPIAGLALRMAGRASRIGRIRALDGQGRWRALKATVKSAGRGAVDIATGLAVGYLEVAVLMIE
jgi:hypothetical protein